MCSVRQRHRKTVVVSEVVNAADTVWTKSEVDRALIMISFVLYRGYQ